MAQATNFIERQPLQGSLHLSAGAAYVAISAVLFSVWIGFYIFNPFGFDRPDRDTWHHVAVLRELIEHPFSPANPHIPTEESSRYFTPLYLAAALVGRLLGLSPYTLFGYIGAASCVGLVAGCWLFARRYFASEWAPLALLLTLLFAWGVAWGHTGYHNYATLLSHAPYPSTTALVLGLFCWAITLSGLQADRWSGVPLVAIGAFTALVLLVHQLSGAMMVVGAGSLILFHPHADTRTKAVFLSSIGLGCLATLAWPYFNLLDVIGSTTDSRWRPTLPHKDQLSTAFTAAGPALVGIVGFRKPQGGWRWEILLPALLFTGAYAGLYILGSPIAHRVPPAIILFAQLGLVWFILGHVERLGDKRKIAMAVLGILVTAAALITGAARAKDLLVRASAGSMASMAQSLAAHVPAGSVSFATENVVYPFQSTGRRVVSIPRPEPASPSLAERQVATDLFFHADTSLEEREQLATRWNASHIVFAEADLSPDVIRSLRALGQSRKFSHGVEVIAISPPENGEPQP